MAAASSPRLWGGMLVAMPTAMPDEPLSSRLGRRAGSTVGSCSVPSKLSAKSTVSLSMSASISSAMRGQAGFGVAHGRRGVAVDRAEVALAVDQRVAHREILRHARHGVVDRHVAVRVVLAEHFADDAGRFLVGGVGADAHVVHGIQDAPVDRLEPVARIRQGAGDDHAHGVIEVRAAHLLVDVDAVDRADVHRVAVVLDIGHKANYIPQALFLTIAAYSFLPFCLAATSSDLV